MTSPPGGYQSDPMDAVLDAQARAAETEFPGWRLSHGMYGWTAVRQRDGRTAACGSLLGIRALMSVIGR